MVWTIAARRLVLSAICIGLLGRCTPTAEHFMPRYDEDGPRPQGLIVCHGYGCAHQTKVALSAQEWSGVRARFSPPARDSAGERAQIAQAVAFVEILVGARTGTDAHQRRDVINTGDPTQMDCIDQTANTWAYLTMFHRDGLLAYHRVGKPIYRGGILTFDLSNTAVIVEAASGRRFAVDPTLVDAGTPPPIEPAEQWMIETAPVWNVPPYPN